ncbi:MAG: MATE family efflux transporter [Clostridiales bacterium]|nr:MATE family efflux transporter [Clostridiales bacterium]
MDKPVVIETKSLYRTLVRVALPIFLQSLIASSLNLVDNLMVGSLGEAELAAVGLSVQFFLIHYGVMFGFASGSAAFFSQFFGAKDLGNIKKVLGFAVSFCFLVSLFFFIPAMVFPEKVLSVFTDIPEAIDIGKDYVRIVSLALLTVSITVPCTAALRATQQTAKPLFISMVSFSVNTILNFILIFGHFGFPKMGVVGAATATLIARIIKLILILYIIFVRDNILKGSLKEFIWIKALATRVLASALPVTINEAAWSLGMAAYNAFYGRLGITEYAAIQASSTINSLFILCIFSLADAIIILVGQRIGMGEMEYAFALAKRLLRIGVFVGIISGALLILSSRFIVVLFNFTEVGKQYTIWILMIYGVFLWLKVYCGLNIVGVLRSGGDTKYAMLVEIGCVWLIGVPLVFIGVFYLKIPVYFIVLLVHVEEVVKGLILRRRFYSRKWLRNLIKGF